MKGMGWLGSESSFPFAGGLDSPLHEEGHELGVREREEERPESNLGDLLT